MKKLSTLLAVAALSAASFSMNAETVWAMPGAYQGEWSLEKNLLTDNGNGGFSQHLDELTGDFKIVRYEAGSPSWNDQWGSNGSGVQAGVPYTPTFKNGGPDPANIVLAGKSTVMKDVTITVTPGSDNAITLLIEAGQVIEQGDLWYLVGDITGWNFPAKNQFTAEGNGVYTYDYEGTFSKGFKFVKNGSWSLAYVYNDPMDVNVEYTMSGPADTMTNCTLAADVNNPRFVLTDNGTTVTVKIVPDAAGIEAVEADAAAGEAVYYNLQGQRVANPENGLFIRVQGGKAVKVAL